MGWCRQPHGQVHRHDDREMYGVHAEVDEDWPQNWSEDDDRWARIKEHAHDEKQDVDEEQ